jgi:mannose-binding lectin 2
VRLTPDERSTSGSIWNNYPCKLRNWELHVQFKAHGKATDLFGDGLAIWYTKHRLEAGPVFGSKDPFVGLAIFLDTYANQNGPHNHGHPYISAMVNNGTLRYDHDRDGTHTELDGCESHFRNSRHDTYIAIRYEENKLTVSVDIDGLNTWKQCFTVSNVRLPTGYYFGASAATGDLSDNHDIISMKLYDIGTNSDTKEDDVVDYSKIEPSADFFAPPRDHVHDPKVSTLSRLPGWKMIFIVVIAIVGVIICGMVGYILYSKSQENSRKRFY